MNIGAALMSVDCNALLRTTCVKSAGRVLSETVDATDDSMYYIGATLHGSTLSL